MQDTTSGLVIAFSERQLARHADLKARMRALDPTHPMYETRLSFLQRLESNLIAAALRRSISAKRGRRRRRAK